LSPVRDGDLKTLDQIIFFVAKDADEADFPSEIQGHEVVLRRMAEPKPQKMGL
jgi:hypothetical protein